jgi:hypothetical protein
LSLSKLKNAIAKRDVSSTQLLGRSRHFFVHCRNALNVVLLSSTKLCCTNPEKISTINNSEKLPLHKQSIISFTFQVSVLDFLTQETVKMNSQHCPAIVQKQVLDSSANKLKLRFDSDRAQHLLEDLLQSHEQPLPMTVVAKRLGYSKRVLYRNFPELCRAISAQYVKYVKESRIRRIEQCCEDVKQAVQQFSSEGIYPSEAAISQLLAKPGCFRDKKVRAALRAARREICLEP